MRFCCRPVQSIILYEANYLINWLNWSQLWLLLLVRMRLDYTIRPTVWPKCHSRLAYWCHVTTKTSWQTDTFYSLLAKPWHRKLPRGIFLAMFFFFSFYFDLVIDKYLMVGGRSLIWKTFWRHASIVAVYLDSVCWVVRDQTNPPGEALSVIA